MINNLFSGSCTLARFIFRRDRVRLLIWLIGLAGFIVALVPVFENIIISGDASVMSNMMENPAVVAMVGPVYGVGNYTTGAAYSNMMLVFSVMIAGIMNIYLVARHTRQDEEQGRLEVIRSLPVGRLSNLASTMLVSVTVNVALAIISGLGMYVLRETGMTLAGCMLFGTDLGVIGLFFAAVTAVFCQCTANNRTAVGLAIMSMLVLYMLRAVGDVSSEGLSLISPLGLILRTETFVNNYWWPVWLILGISIVLAVLALALARARDLGRGLVPERPGRHHASALLSTPIGLALKLLKTQIMVWAITIFVLAAMYGSVFGDLESFVKDNEMLRAIFTANSEYSYAEQFIALLMTIMSMIAAIPVLTFAGRVSAEERHGYAEHLLGRAVSRYEQMAAYLILALIVSVALQILLALGFWSVGSVVMSEIPSLGTFLQSALSYLPAIWVLMGVSVLLVAFVPRYTALTYVYLGYTFVSVYLGTIADFPEWTRKLTPFGYVPQYPIEKMETAPLIILTGIAAILVASGCWRYGHRDVANQ